MWQAKERTDWLKVGVAVAWVCNRNGWGGEPVHPLAIIPGPFRPATVTREKTPEEVEDESRRAWLMMDRFFEGAHGRHQRRRRR